MNKPIHTPIWRRLITRVPATMLAVAAMVGMLALPAYADDPVIDANPKTLSFSIGDNTPKSTTITWTPTAKTMRTSTSP